MSRDLHLVTRAGGAALCLGLAALAIPAASPAFGRDVPAVDITIPGVTSQAAVAQQLQSQGYSGIRLTSAKPSPVAPTPQWYSGRDNPQTTPVHQGWNGTAMRGGQTVQVIVHYGTAPSVAEVPR